ncbi:MAG: M60 family metallopeptidase [Peptostreptococcaceae bacterium]
MKRKISSTLAVTIIASQMQSITFAENTTNIPDINNNEVAKVAEKYEVKGKLELDINFALPIKFTQSNKTNISVKLKQGNEEIGIVNLGSDNLNGNLENKEINYKLEALDGKKSPLKQGETELQFYHLTFENLPLGTYELEVIGDGYETAQISNIEIQNSSKRVSIGTSDKTIVLDDNIVESYQGVFLVGNIDSTDLVTMSDYEILKDAIKNKRMDTKFDLNRDGKVDITDLTYVHQNKDKSKGSANIESTDIIINPENISIDDSKLSIEEGSDIKDIFKDNGKAVVLSPKPLEDGQIPELSEENPIQIPINLAGSARATSTVEQIVIKSPTNEGPSKGSIIIDGKEYPYSESESITINGMDEIVVDLGEQVAVSQITINVTGSRGNKNLAQIAKVDFLNNVYKEIPKPKMSIPVINNFTSKTAVGNEEMVLGWEHQANVTGYEVKVEEVNDKGQVLNKSTYKTNENTLKIEKVNGYSVYRVSIQSLSGDEWKSGYKDEQENYDSTATGQTNLSTNKNDKDGKPDNADKNYITQGWDSTSGILSSNASGVVEDAYNEELKSANNYGADSIVEVQVIPETAPEGPEGISAHGLYKGLSLNWKAHKKAKDYDIYYRKVGEGAWNKANDPKDPKYVDSNTTNDIPDGVTNLKPNEKLDKDELIRGTQYVVNGLEDGATYEIKMTATNHHGTGGLSQTYLGKTSKLVEPNIPGYKLINKSSENGLTQNIENVEFGRSGDGYVGDPASIVDGDYKTAWKIKDWDGGVHYGQRMPIVTFNKEYTFDTIRLATKLEELNIHTLPSDAKLRTYDENGDTVQTIHRQDISVKHITDKNGARYAELKLKEPVTAKKVELNLSVYSGENVSISELKFYEYDSLENDVDNLFKDNLMLELKSHVTQQKIDELTKRAKTIDSYSMEYHPNQEQILSDIKRAQDLLDDINIKDDIKVLDASINSSSKNNIGQSNDYQALGVAVKPGDKVNIYIGSDRENTEFDLGISQHYGESSTGFKTYSQKLKVGKNEIVIPETGFDMDYEKGGNLYLKFSRNYNEGQTVKVRVSGGSKIPHLNLNNIIDDKSKESEAKEEIRNYIKELKTYVTELPSKYPTKEDKVNNIYKYDSETSILNSTEIEGDRITLSLPADQVLKGIREGISSEEQQVNRVYETMLAWEQLMKVSYAKQGLLESPVDFNGDGKVDNTPLDELGGKNENQYFNDNKAPENRINIKYQRMFTGAFMYASSHHVGIGYGSSPSMMQGVPFKFDESGKLVNSQEGNLFGWGIGHEIGHVHDRPGLTYAETTNNMLAQLTQTFNDEAPSRVEGSMEEIYKRVTSHSVGTPKGLTGLGMYWQLHLAYDNDYTYEMLDKNTDGDLGNDSFYAKLYRKTRENGVAPNESGHDSTAQTFIMRSSDAVEKDLREFFERWGIVASPNTNKYLDGKNYPKEDKAIYYLNDEARRKRLKAIDNNNLQALEMARNIKVNARFGTDKNYINQKEVPLEFSVDKDNDKILGYEIIRKEATSTGTKEVVSGFVPRDEENSITKYTDVIDAVNNRTFGYKVRVYDYNLNVSDTFDIGTVKVTHDGSIAKSSFTFDTNTRGKDDVVDENAGHGQVENGSINNIKDNDKSTVYNASKTTDQNGNVVSGDPYVTIDMGENKSVVGLKYTPGQADSKKFSLKNLFSRNKEITYSPISNYEVYVSQDNKSWTKAHSGKFDTTKENVIYFNEAGNSNNSQLWTHNAKYVKLVAKGASTISIAELGLIGPPGDNIEIGMDNNDQNYKNGIGRLKLDYEYAPGKSIPSGSILVMGEYRGDPAFNVPLILNENDENFALESQVILLANLPENSELGEVAEGNYIYWITPEQQDKVINGEANIEGKSVKAELYRYNKLDSNNAPIGQRLVSDTFLVDLPSNLDDLPMIDLSKSMTRGHASYNEVIEINSEVAKKAFENRK